MLLAIFLVSLLAIGVVSAADNSSDDNIVGEAPGADLASSATNDVLTADEQTFTQLNQTINGNGKRLFYLKNQLLWYLPTAITNFPINRFRI